MLDVGSTEPTLVLTIKNAEIGHPDSDGDISQEILIEFKNESSKPVEFISCKTYAFSSDGKLLDADSDENDDYVESGDTWSGELRGGYLKSYMVSGGRPKALVEVLACACVYHNLGAFELSPECLLGSSQKVDLGHGVNLTSMSVSVSSPDDDGEVNVKLSALLDNQGSAHIPKAVLSGSLTRSGREIEELSNYSDPVPVGQMTVIEASTYVKQRQLSGASIEVKLSIFPIVVREVAEGDFS